MNYQPSLKEMRFVLNELSGLEALSKLPGFENTSVDLVDAVLDEAAKFAVEVMQPLNNDNLQIPILNADEVSLPAAVCQAWQQYIDAGWQSLRSPEEFGGQALPALLGAAVDEMWSSSNLAFSLLPMLTQGAVEAIKRHASDDLKNLYLPKLISGEWTGTMNLTEPQAGSDLSRVRSQAQANSDGSYRLHGQKIFITWGDHNLAENIVHLVLARLPDAPAGIKGISLFLVPKRLVNADGSLGAHNDLHCLSLENKLGLHGSPTAVMSFGDKSGAVGFLIGEAHQGVPYMFTMMNHSRLGVAIEGLAVSEAAYQAAAAYAKERVQSRQLGSVDKTSVPIIRHPDIRRMLLSMKSQIEAQRALTYSAALALDLASKHTDAAERAKQQALVDFLIPIVKGWNTEQANEITSLAIQVFGGMGYIEETGVAQYYRDARVTSIYEGTTGIQALDLLARKLELDGGKCARWLLSQAMENARYLQIAGFDGFAVNLEQSIKQAEHCIVFLLSVWKDKPQLAAAGAVPFLKLMGITLGGWQLGRTLLITKEKLKDKSSDSDFYQAKQASALFYSEHILPQTAGLSHAIVEGADSVLAMEERWF